MSQVRFKMRVGPDGVLHVPLGETQANRDVQVTIEPVNSANAHSREDYLAFLQTTAGAWQGGFERPDQGEYETRDAME